MDAPIRLLVVDDEAPQMKAICDTLEDQGYAPTGFTDAHAALAALKPGRFDLLMTDLTMPAMDGIALLRAALAKDPDLVGIIMTGAGTIATAVGAMQAGAFDYILKPFKLSAILPVLARAVAMRRLRLDNADLQQRVRERTAELEAVNRGLETFSYSISHDLRAPLRAIGGFAAILVEDHAHLLPPDACDLLTRVVANAKRMEQLIKDLLQFSRLGNQPLDAAPVQVGALVEEVLEEQRRDHPARSVAVELGALPDCHGDRPMLRQVFVNLLSNAFKYTRDRAEARVAIGCREEAGERIYFVRDNGVGFDPQNAKDLFGVFKRLHPADQFEGTGIGLSVVQRIVQRHGGRIWAEAAVGQGATFHFTLAAPPA